MRKGLETTDIMQIRSCLPALKPWQPSSIHGTEQLQMTWSARQDRRSKLLNWLLQPVMFSWKQNTHSTKIYVVHHNTLSDSFRIRIVWFQPKQESDTDIIFPKQDRIG